MMGFKKKISLVILLMLISVPVVLWKLRRSRPPAPKGFVWLVRDNPSAEILRLYNEGLLEWDEERNQFTFALAESMNWKTNKVITFQIRRNAKWSDGSPLEANHFLQSWKDTLQNCAVLPEAAKLFVIENARAFCEKTIAFDKVGISAEGPETLTVTLNKGNFLELLVFTESVSWPKPLNGKDLTSGPFLQPSPRNEKQILSPNQHYYRKNSSVATIEVIPMESTEERILKFANQEADFVDEIEFPLLTRTQTLKGAIFVPQHRIVGLSFGVGVEENADALSLRMALRYSIDQLELSELVGQVLEPVDFFWGGVSSTQDSLFQLSQALALFPEAGSRNRSVLLGSLIPSAARLPYQREITENLISQWRKNLQVNVLSNAVSEGAPPNPVMVRANLFLLDSEVGEMPNSFSSLLSLIGGRGNRPDAAAAWKAFQSGKTLSAVFDPLQTWQTKLFSDKALAFPLARTKSMVLLNSYWQERKRVRKGKVNVKEMLLSP